MNKLDGYKKFEKLMADFMPSFLKPIVEQKIQDPNFFTEQKEIEFIIFNGYSEISNSIETLKLIEKFVKIKAPIEEGIDYSNYLTYHVHNYLQEMYILKERLKTYSKIIQRKYSKALDKQLLERIIESLMKIILEALSSITGEGGARNIHVHAEKFKDNELKWLSSTTLLANFHKEFEIQSQIAYQTAKTKWHKRIYDNNQELDKLIDMYFNTMYTIISVDDKVVLPHEYNKQSNKTLETNS